MRHVLFVVLVAACATDPSTSGGGTGGNNGGGGNTGSNTGGGGSNTGGGGSNTGGGGALSATDFLAQMDQKDCAEAFTCMASFPATTGDTFADEYGASAQACQTDSERRRCPRRSKPRSPPARSTTTPRLPRSASPASRTPPRARTSGPTARHTPPRAIPRWSARSPTVLRASSTTIARTSSRTVRAASAPWTRGTNASEQTDHERVLRAALSRAWISSSSPTEPSMTPEISSSPLACRIFSTRLNPGPPVSSTARRSR